MVEALRHKPKDRGFDSRWCHGNFSLTLSFRLCYDHKVDSASNRNEYQEYFLGGKSGRCVGLTISPPLCANCLEIWSLNRLEPSGRVQACNCFFFFYYRERSPLPSIHTSREKQLVPSAPPTVNSVPKQPSFLSVLIFLSICNSIKFHLSGR